MQTFFFHVHGHAMELDEEGVSLPDARTAAVEAARFAGELLAHTPQLLLDERQVRVEVTDGERPLFAVRVVAERLTVAAHANER